MRRINICQVLSSILYGELYRIALEYTRMTGLNVDDFLSKAKLQDLDSIYNNYWKHEETAKFMLWTPCKSID